MKSNICYCSVDGAHAVVRNRDNSAGTQPPELVMGMPCELQLRLFADSGDTTPFPTERFSGIVSWSFAMDTDFSPHSTVKLVAKNADIRLSEVAENGITYTQLTIPIPETYTAELAAALDGKECIILAGELIGYDNDHEEVFVLQIKGFKVYGRIAGLGETRSILSVVCENLAEEAVNSILASGGYVISSGAAVIASGAAATVSAALDERIVNASESLAARIVSVSSSLDSRIGAVSGGLQTQIAAVSGGLTLRPTSGGAEQIASAVVGPISSSLDSRIDAVSGGLQTQIAAVSGGLALRPTSGGAEQIASAVVTAGGYKISGGNVAFACSLTVFSKTVSVYGSMNFYHQDSLKVNGAIVATQPWVMECVSSGGYMKDLVYSSEGTATSAAVPVLSGGTMLEYASALSALAVDSVTKSIRESYIRFTLASGGSVSLPAAGIDYLGEAPSFAGGKSYLLGFFNGIMATNEVV